MQESGGAAPLLIPLPNPCELQEPLIGLFVEIPVFRHAPPRVSKFFVRAAHSAATLAQGSSSFFDHLKFSINIRSAVSFMCLRYTMLIPSGETERPMAGASGLRSNCSRVPSRRSRPVFGSITWSGGSAVDRGRVVHALKTYTKGGLLDAGEELPRWAAGERLDEQWRV